MKRESPARQDWADVFLLDNPFRTVPPRQRLGEIVWADMAGQKKEIEDAIRFSLQTSPSNLVLNWGPYGGGKSHAALYFTQPEILESICRKANKTAPLALMVTIPRGRSNVIRTLYLNILGKLKMKILRDAVEHLVKEVGEERALDLLEILSGNEEFATALYLLSGARPKGQLQLFQASEFLLSRYFLLSASKPEVRQLGLARSIESETDMISILATILNLLVLKAEEMPAPLFSELFLWFDEVEELVTLPSREQAGLTSFLRDLIDYVPNNLTIFLNFTLKTPGIYENIWAYLSEAVQSRVRKEFLFGELDLQDALLYVRELLAHPKYRSPELKEQCPDDIFPFDRSGLEYLFSILEPRTPRGINETCTFLIERALVEGQMKSPQDRIDETFIRRHQEDLPSVKKPEAQAD